jgi:hypothetical protein
LIGGRGGAHYYIRNTESECQQFKLVERRQQPIGKARGEECGPEAIAGPRKVMAHGGRVQSGIDAAKENAQAGRDYVANSLALGGAELRFSWFPGLSQEWLVLLYSISKRTSCEALCFEILSMTVTFKM